MGRIILLLVLAYVVYVLIKATVRRSRPPVTGDGPLEYMVACRHCGVHLPTSEALRKGADFYCSEDHRRLGPG